MYFILLLIAGFLMFYYFVKYFEKKHSYWRDLGVDSPKYYYFVGHILDQILNRRNLGEIITGVYNEFTGYNYVGFYNSTTPALIIRNTAIIEDILVKEFSSFHDNGFDADDDDPLQGKNPFVLNGDRWKKVRGHVVPCFTSNKTKKVLPMLYGTSKKLLEYLKKYPTVCVNAKDLSARIFTENVADCAFGIEGQSFETCPVRDTNRESRRKHHCETFYEMTQELLNPSSADGVKTFLSFLFPFLSLILPNDNKLPKISSDLKNIVHEALQTRNAQQTRRNDFLDFFSDRMKQINDSSLFDEADIARHASGFIVDGIHTSTLVFQHLLYELGRDQIIQEKLREEIAETRRNLSRKENMTYEMIQEMKYLDAILNEVLRLHPPFFMYIKRVTRPFTLMPMREDNSGPCLTLPLGMYILLPIYGLHLDEKYHKAPKMFKPDRFLGESVECTENFTFLPFGSGPRKCLGSNFGTLQVKLAIITLVQNYEIKINCKTKEPVRSDPGSFVNEPKGGYWIDLIKLDAI